MIKFKIVPSEQGFNEALSFIFKNEVRYSDSYWFFLNKDFDEVEHKLEIKKLLKSMLVSWRDILSSNSDLTNKILVFDWSDEYIAGFQFKEDQVYYSISRNFKHVNKSFLSEFISESLIVDFLLKDYDKNLFLKDIQANIILIEKKINSSAGTSTKDS